MAYWTADSIDLTAGKLTGKTVALQVASLAVSSVALMADVLVALMAASSAGNLVA